VPFLEQIFWDRYGMLPKHIVFLNVAMEKEPYCDMKRYEIKKFYENGPTGSITFVKVRFGFMEEPDVEEVLEGIAAHEKINIDEHPENWLIHIAQERIFQKSNASFLHSIRYEFYHYLSQNARTYDKYFGLGRKVGLSVESIPVRFE
jgi:K+ transporter